MSIELKDQAGRTLHTITANKKVWMKHGNSLVLLDEEGRMSQLYVIPKPSRCSDLCGHVMRRFHATCLWCEWGKIYRRNKCWPFVWEVPCTVYFLLPRKYRRFAPVKNALLKRVLTIAEMLAH